MSKYIIILFISSFLIAQGEIEKKDFSIPPLLQDEMTDLELMLVANINTNEILSEFLKLNAISNSMKLNAPTYDRFARKIILECCCLSIPHLPFILMQVFKVGLKQISIFKKIMIVIPLDFLEALEKNLVTIIQEKGM